MSVSYDFDSKLLAQQGREIDRLKREVSVVLAREAATIQRYDAKLDALATYIEELTGYLRLARPHVGDVLGDSIDAALARATA